MRTINNILIAVSIILYTSCTSEYEQLNSTPNDLTDAKTPYLLTSVQQSIFSVNSSMGMNKTLMLYVQLWAQREETVRSRYSLSSNGTWSGLYGRLDELATIIEYNQGEEKDIHSFYGANENQIAIAEILTVWVYSSLTNLFGDIPYTEALNPNINYPKYDAQSEIYPDLLRRLKEAVAMLDNNKPGFTTGDLMYGGDVSKWIKFGNSLRARLALSIMSASEALAKEHLQQALEASVMSSNSDGAVLKFQTSDMYAHPIYLEYRTQHWTRPSELLVNTLSSLNDPRLGEMVSQNAKGDYVGMPYGLSDDESLKWSLDVLSELSEKTRQPDFPGILMSYSELMFIKAEAIELGVISGDAQAAYQEAIRANMEFWGISSNDIAIYLVNPQVAYNSDRYQELIGLQKWIAFYPQGLQAFVDWRRLGYPILEVLYEKEGLTLEEGMSGHLPRRFSYPTSEESLNKIQLDAAINKLGGNTQIIRTWMDPE